MRRVWMPDSGAESWMVLGDGHAGLGTRRTPRGRSSRPDGPRRCPEAEQTVDDRAVLLSAAKRPK